INGIEKIECLVVPLIISAAGTAEELAAAAVTRGIDNPVKKTSAVDIRFSFIDYISLAVGVLLIGAAFCL
ncbi:MAG: energy-coupling factor transporter transmembrane protein EcfT, partial [Firmicutes bacterium]|nr:energy-coupling factor transporter transmembrane protein EcfT [Bacillota bacterium]